VTTTTETRTTQVFRVFIRATPEQIWEAMTKSEFTRKYFYGSSTESTYEVGAPVLSHGEDGTLMRDGEVLESDPPRRLVTTWRSLWDEETAAEPPSRVTYEIEQTEPGVCQVTVIHDQLEKSPKTAGSIEGWTYILSGLKTLLETGQPLAQPGS
jgi:uncharacterized protein YndB with AHSA1/START domain